MDSVRSPERAAPTALKIILAGPFGVGKTTTVAAISEISPLTTEAGMTSLSLGIDDRGDSDKVTTTVAMDFGRVTVDNGLKLYLFGTPGQRRFGFMWDDLVRGALGVVIIVDSRRIGESHAAIDYVERTNLPYVIAVNTFDGELAYSLSEIRWALTVHESVPVVAFDARSRVSVRDTLLILLDQALVAAYRMRV